MLFTYFELQKRRSHVLTFDIFFFTEEAELDCLTISTISTLLFRINLLGHYLQEDH